MSLFQTNWRLFGHLVLLLLLSGCEKPAQPPQQYEELHRITIDKRSIIPRVVDDTPLRFGAIDIVVVGPNDRTIGARAEVEPTEDLEKVQDYLKKRVSAVRSDLKDGRAKLMVLRFDYFDQSGKSTGADSLNLTPPERKVRIEFKSMGLSGAVHRVDVALESIIWESQGKETTVPLK